MPASPFVLVSDNGGPFNSPNGPPNYGLDINAGDLTAIKLASTSGVATWYLQIGLVNIIGGVPVSIPNTGTDEVTALSIPSLTGVNPVTGQVSTPSTVVTFNFPAAGSALLFTSTITGTFGVVTSTFVLFARTAEGYRVGPAGMTREGSGAAGWAAIINPAIRAVNTLWGVEVQPLADGFLYYNGATLTWNVLGGDITPGVTGGGSQALEVTGIKGTAVPTLTSGYLHFNGAAFVWDNPPGAVPSGTGIWYAVSSALHGNAITLTGDISQGSLSGNNVPIEVTGIRSVNVPTLASGFLHYDGSAFAWETPPGTSVTGTGLWYSAGSTLDGSAVTLGGDLTQGALSGTTLGVTVSGLKGTAVPTLASGYLHYNGASFVWDTPSGGGGAVVVKTVDVTGAGTDHTGATITAFDGTYVTITGLGASGPVMLGYGTINQPYWYGPALSGTAATVTAFDGVTNYATIGGLTGMTSDIVGKTMSFSGFGNPGNNGTFNIVAYISSSSVQVLNTTPGVSPDSGGTWNVSVGALDGTTLVLTVDSVTLGSITNITNSAGLYEIQTATPTSLITGDYVFLSQINSDGSMGNLNNNAYSITVVDPTHFTLNGEVFSGEYLSGGIVSTGPKTLALSGATTAASMSALFAAIHATWPTVTATLGGAYGTGLTLTGSTLGPAGSITSEGWGTANYSYFQLYNTVHGFAGVDVGGQTPTALQLVGFYHAGNNGTFNVHAWVDSATVTVLNHAGVAPDLGMPAVIEGYNNISSGALYGAAMSGVGAAITSFTSPLATVTGLSGMTPDIVGKTMTFSGFLMNPANNDGTFIIAGYISATSVTINNANAVSPDSGGIWSVPAGTLDGTTLILNVDGAGPLTLTLSGAGNAASQTALFTAIEAQWPNLTASINTSYYGIKLTDNSLFGPSSTIVPGGGSANGYLGIGGSGAGSYAQATFAVSLAGGSPLITEAGILSLTGTPVNDSIPLSTQSVGAFRCLVESLHGYAAFAAPNNPNVNNTITAISSDGTTVNYDTTIPSSPQFVIQALSGSLAGSPLYVDPQPNTPFTYTVYSGSTGLGSIIIQNNNQPFYGFVTNESTQPAILSDSSSRVVPDILRPGQAALVVGDGSTGVWSIPAVSGDNGRTARSSRYLLQRANTVGAPAVNLSPPDLLWGANHGDGSIGPLTQDIIVTAPKIYPSGSDIAVLGNILYCGGSVALPTISGTGYTITNVDGVYFVTGLTGMNPSLVGQNIYLASYGTAPVASVVNATTITLNLQGVGVPTPGNYVGYSWVTYGTSPGNLGAYSLGTGQLMAWANLGEDGIPPNTVIGFKMAPEPIDGGTYFVNDGIFVVDDTSAYVLGLGTAHGFFSLTQFTGYSGTWTGGRGIMILGNDAASGLPAGEGGFNSYSTVSVWTDPVNNYLWLADFVNSRFSTSSLYFGYTPHAICLDPSTENFWVVQEGTQQVSLLSLNLKYTGSAPTLNTISSFYWPQQVSSYGGKLDDILFDGTYLWAIDRLNNTYYQLTPNGFVVSTHTLTVDDYQTLDMSSDSRLYFDGSYVWITGLVINNLCSAVVSIHPGTGLPFEYYPFSALATRGMAFDKGFAYVYTFGAIDTNSSGSVGTLYTTIGGQAQFSDFSANWTSADVGDFVRISGGTVTANNGIFQIVGFIDSHNIYIGNPSADGLPGSDELNNGLLIWQQYGRTGIAARLNWDPPAIDYGTLDSILTCPGQITGWGQTARLGARVVEYTGYTTATTFSLFQQNVSIPPLPGTRVLFIDRDGNAGTYPLTIDGDFQSINGVAQYVINTDYGYVELEWDGGTWLIIRSPGGGGGLPIANPIAPCTFNADANSLQSFQTTSGIPTVTFNYPLPGTSGSAISSLATPAMMTIDFSIRLQDTTTDQAAWWKFSWAVSVQAVGTTYNQLGPALNTFIIGTAGGIPPTGWGVVVQYDGTHQYIQAVITGDPSDTCNGSIEAEWNLVQ